MSRIHKDWLKAYLEYSSYSEAPDRMRFWSGVSAVAGALRRKVWIDQAYFRWYPNFYIVIVAPPGVVSKSTTAGVAMDLLRNVKGIRFGPDVVTWPALVQGFAESAEAFEWQGAYHTMSAMTLESSEFGNLLDPQDRAMVDLYVSLWDGKQGVFKKETKTSGNDTVENPWINMIACTTPAWIAGSFPEYLIGGGFTSRCVFIYADQKKQMVAYPKLVVPKDLPKQKENLVKDLTEIASLTGEYQLTPEAYRWGTEWYERHNSKPPAHLNDERFGGYLARKQTHIHKLAMVIAAAKSNHLWVEAEHLATAESMVTDLEPEMAQVFSRIGRSEESAKVDRLVHMVRNEGPLEYAVLLRRVHRDFPHMRNFEDIMANLVKAKILDIVQSGTKMLVSAGKLH